MSDAALAYLISLGIIGVGVIWIFAGANSATSTIWIAIGILINALVLGTLLGEELAVILCAALGFAAIYRGWNRQAGQWR